MGNSTGSKLSIVRRSGFGDTYGKALRSLSLSVEYHYNEPCTITTTTRGAFLTRENQVRIIKALAESRDPASYLGLLPRGLVTHLCQFVGELGEAGELLVGHVQLEGKKYPFTWVGHNGVLHTKF